jgi:hypothetical protein
VNASNSAWPMTTSVSYARPSSPDPEFLAGLPRRSRLNDMDFRCLTGCA